ncbi:hypothetical protein BIWAKO_03433 [Bosea sp. BIWAKO-01]|nr:hypothetical protein BIWAKO_03433 [Bosea sp. BIWAKO-01]
MTLVLLRNGDTAQRRDAEESGGKLQLYTSGHRKNPHSFDAARHSFSWREWGMHRTN